MAIRRPGVPALGAMPAVRLAAGITTSGPAGLPAGWTFADGLLPGPTADLKYGGYLAYTDLTGVNLGFANLGGAQFEHDNLTRAVFWGSNATAGNFYQDTWSDIVCPDGTNSNLYVAGCFSARLYEFAGFISPRPGSTLRKSIPRFGGELPARPPGRPADQRLGGAGAVGPARRAGGPCRAAHFARECDLHLERQGAVSP